MTNYTRTNLFGILGGLGPLASAEFLKTIYERGGHRQEQELPPVVMLSDPSFPDRTKTFLNGEDDLLLDRLVHSLRLLREMGATKTVICCVTIHHLLPRLPQYLRETVWSLLDVIFSEIEKRGGRHLLLCSSGTRQMQIFESHARWESAKAQLVLPDSSDQQKVHRELIYALKRDAELAPMLPFVEQLLAKYEVNSFVAGCTELHLMAKTMARRSAGEAFCIDPLETIACEVARQSIPDHHVARVHHRPAFFANP